MSDYVRTKCVRLPFPNELLKYSGKDHPLDCEEFIEENYRVKVGRWNSDEKREKFFEITCTDKAWYLDYIYRYTYGAESGEFGNARYLTDKEFYVVEGLFDKIVFKVNKSDLRVIDYCYYNGGDAPDYYEVLDKDDSEEMRL